MGPKKRLAIFLIVVGLILYLDDMVFHWFGDLSAWDNYNPYLHHWMLGLVSLLVGMALYIQEHKKT